MLLATRSDALFGVWRQGGMFPNWQPITTAPKDGTRVLIFEPGFHMPGCIHAISAGTIRVSYWRKDTIPMGWTGRERAPSHWLPLPPPPNSASFTT
jgi:hypothetical protein